MIPKQHYPLYHMEEENNLDDLLEMPMKIPLVEGTKASDDFRDKVNDGTHGLNNPAARCWFIAATQALLRMPYIYQMARTYNEICSEEDHVDDENPEKEMLLNYCHQNIVWLEKATSEMDIKRAQMMKAFVIFARKYWFGNHLTKSISPEKCFKVAAKLFCPDTPDGQNDAHEFFNGMLSVISEITGDLPNHLLSAEELAERRSKLAEYSTEDGQYDWRCNFPTPGLSMGEHFSLISKLVSTCDVCHNSSIKHSIETCLLLPVPISEEPIALSECIDRLTQTTRLEAKRGEHYTCEHCKCNRDASQTTSFRNPPKVLFMSLKRHSVNSMGFINLNDTPVEYPESLEFEFEDAGKVEYRLSSVVCHLGSNPSSGHYYTYALNTDGYWYRYDDNRVSPCFTGEPRKTTKAPFVQSRSAYILVYLRAQECASGYFFKHLGYDATGNYAVEPPVAPPPTFTFPKFPLGGDIYRPPMLPSQTMGLPTLPPPTLPAPPPTSSGLPTSFPLDFHSGIQQPLGMPPPKPPVGLHDLLFRAVLLGDLSIIREILKSNPHLVDTNMIGGGPSLLMIACSTGNQRVQGMLVAFGANLAYTDFDGKTALDYLRAYQDGRSDGNALNSFTQMLHSATIRRKF